MVEVVGTAFAVTLIVLSLGVSYIAFSLKNTFAGGMFERAWLVIAISPIVYAVVQGFELWQAVTVATPSLESAEGVINAVFLVMLLYGFYKFASAWRPAQGTPKGG